MLYWLRLAKFILLGLTYLSVLAAPVAFAGSEHSARLGDLLITVTGIGALPLGHDLKTIRQPRSGHHFVAVRVNVKNVGTHPNCTDFDKWLKVDANYEYPSDYVTYLKPPRTSNLLPTEESEGIYTFEIKDGAKPVALKLVRNTVGDEFCRMMQHRSGALSGRTKVTLSLHGLPSPAFQLEKPSAASSPKLPPEPVPPAMPPPEQKPSDRDPLERLLKPSAAGPGISAGAATQPAGGDRYSQQLGDLKIRATGVRTVYTLHHPKLRAQEASSGWHFIVVEVSAENVGERAVCSYLMPRLKAEPGLEYGPVLIGGPNWPNVHELLPGEQAKGGYAFEVKDGVRPLELILEHRGASQSCTRGERFLIFGPTTVRLALEGLPTSSKQR